MDVLRIIKQWISDIAGTDGKALHLCDGDNHHVVMRDLRVVIVKDGDGSWFAQGIDVNYGTSGATIKEAQKNFEAGLSMTIKANLERIGNIDRIMKTPSFDAWGPLISDGSHHFDFSSGVTHTLTDETVIKHLLSNKVTYIESVAKAA